MEQKKKKKKRFGFLIRFILKMAVFAAVAWAVLNYVITFYRVTGNNMFPNVKAGDLCFINRLDEYTLNDIVYYETEGKMRLGRIVAIEGQEIDYPDGGGYLVDGYIPSEEITYQTFQDEESDYVYPATVGKDAFYVLNDFRSDTKDSRKYGDVKKEQITGKVIFILRRRGF